MDQSRIEEALGGGDSSGALDPRRMRAVLAQLARPQALARELPTFTAELTKVLLGLSELQAPSADPQFSDPAWREHALYRRVAQSYLAWVSSVERLRPEGDDWQGEGRANYFTDIVTGALSPANFVLTNPAAVRRMIDTGGFSVLRGARNFARDVVRNGAMPSMVDTKPFKVGENIAQSPGAVVHREDMFELLQYSPTTDTVHERPLLFVPPQINRYYIMDLAPKRSLVEFAVSNGMQSFMISWRNPSRDRKLGHGSWGLEDYVAATTRAFEVVQEITGADDINVLGFCAGGVTSALAQAALAANGTSPVYAATYLVTLMDARKPNMVTALSTPGTAANLTARATKAQVIAAKKLAANFRWMRPKDLVYGNLVNTWVMGNDPTAFDLLAWNDDQVNISSTFTRDSLEMLSGGTLLQPGAATALGAPIDLASIKSDNFIVTAETDHITTWRPCYMTSQLLGGDTEAVLINKGHIQAVVSPVERSRHRYWAGPADDPDPDRWRQGAKQYDGSWWVHWAEWLNERAGAQKPAPASLGSAEHPSAEPAPGTYVHER